MRRNTWSPAAVVHSGPKPKCLESGVKKARDLSVLLHDRTMEANLGSFLAFFIESIGIVCAMGHWLHFRLDLLPRSEFRKGAGHLHLEKDRN